LPCRSSCFLKVYMNKAISQLFSCETPFSRQWLRITVQKCSCLYALLGTIHAFSYAAIFLICHFQSESELLYDWRFTANQFLATSPLRLTVCNFVFQLNTCGCSLYVTSSLTRGWVCRLSLLLVLASAVILRSDSRGTHDHLLLFQSRESPNLEGQVPIFISPGTGWPGYTRRHWVHIPTLEFIQLWAGVVTVTCLDDQNSITGMCRGFLVYKSALGPTDFLIHGCCIF
jgi:hypothetical protein